MPSKHPSDYTQEEVNIFLNSIGLGHKIDSFKENGVDGPMIVTLTKEDLTNDLEMSNLQARKFQMSLDFAKELVEGGGGGSTSGTDHKEIINSLKEQIKSLEDENEFLKSDVKYLNGVIEDMQQHHASAPELIPEPILEPMSEPMSEPMPPPPATAPHYQPTATAVTTERSTHSTQSRSHSPKPRSNSSTPTRGKPIIAGAAGGALRGAVLGTIGGAIAGDAGQGAKMGAAMGGARGGMIGLAAKRRNRRR